MPGEHDATKRLLCRAQQLPFFSVLTPPQRQFLLNNSVLTLFAAGVRCEGAAETYAGLLSVCSGLMRTFLLSEDGREATLFQLSTGQLCVLPLSPQQTAAAELCFEFLEDCELLCIKQHAIYVLYHTIPAVQQAVLQAAFSHLDQLLWATHVQAFYPLKKRLALLLLERTAAHPAPDAPPLRATHEALARSLRSAREMVSLELERMQQSGILTTRRGKIRILDRDALTAITVDSLP